MKYFLIFFFGICIESACTNSDANTKNIAAGIQLTLEQKLFDPLLADGFDWPIDINQEAKSQPIFSLAKGIVVSISDSNEAIKIEHHFWENNIYKTGYTFYYNLISVNVKRGDTVSRKTLIGIKGNIADDYVRINDTIRKNSPNTEFFISHHAKLLIPKNEKTLLVARKGEMKMTLYNNGIKKTEYEIALSQSPVGTKEKEGDNKLPEGAYTITEKSREPFVGNYNCFLGVAWMRLSYPNSFDARKCYMDGNITKSTMEEIIDAEEKGLRTPQNTYLGGGIGIHGWCGDWGNDGDRSLTWGCISMHNDDLNLLYDKVNIGTRIIILP